MQLKNAASGTLPIWSQIQYALPFAPVISPYGMVSPLAQPPNMVLGKYSKSSVGIIIAFKLVMFTDE